MNVKRRGFVMWLYYFSIVLVVVSNVFYHISQKSTSSSVNPVISMIVSYLTAIIFCLFLLPFFPIKESLISSIKRMNWASFALGISIVGLELGFLLAYRAGWNISLVQFLTTILVSLLLIPVGILFYQEKITLVNAIGVLLCIGGFIFINHK